MPEHLLERAQVAASGQQVRRERLVERVWAHPLLRHSSPVACRFSANVRVAAVVHAPRARGSVVCKVPDDPVFSKHDAGRAVVVPMLAETTDPASGRRRALSQSWPTSTLAATGDDSARPPQGGSRPPASGRSSSVKTQK
jgi:hypothetical protein